MGRGLVPFLVVAAACVQPSSKDCGELVCPSGTVCGPGMCLTEAQTTACKDLVDGDVCQAGSFTGICDLDPLVCIEGCGDGATTGGEECDDGNFTSHDGCSSACRVEAPTWTRVPDPWTARGGHRTQPALSNSPPARFWSSLAYDDAHGAVVLVAGSTTSNESQHDDVWELDGIRWTERPPRTIPSARVAPMVYDSRQRELMLFGGNTVEGVLADTWRYDTGWHERGVPSSSPPVRFFPALAYDAKRDRTILFGGWTQVLAFDDTWAWNDSTETWTEVVSTQRPPGRIIAGMAPTAEGTVVLFGGLDPVNALSDTWELDGSEWTPRTSIESPPALADPAMALDELNGRVVLFEPTGSTWAFANHTWSPVITTAAPSPRSGSVMAFHPARKRVVMCGGAAMIDGELVQYDDCWELDGDRWNQLPIVGTQPVHRARFGFAPHPPTRSVMVFGGSTVSSVAGDQWSLTYLSTTPDEACTNAIDDDGDQQVDTADPDCIAL